jgi:hypothetical protein
MGSGIQIDIFLEKWRTCLIYTGSASGIWRTTPYGPRTVLKTAEIRRTIRGLHPQICIYRIYPVTHNLNINAGFRYWADIGPMSTDDRKYGNNK